jgi:tRNA G18 (ribose-2'-O)-methylase SpoU
MRSFISDPDDQRLADYRQLNDPARRSAREAEGGFFIVEGWEAVQRLLTTDWPVRSVLLRRDQADRLPVPEDVITYLAPRPVLEATVGFQLHRGVVASVTRRPWPELKAVIEGAESVAVLEGLNDHENLGAIYRSAAALGIEAMVLDPTCADPFYRRCIRVSMGTVLTLPSARAGAWPADLDTIRGAGFTLVALTPRPPGLDLGAVERPHRPALLLGSEATGLSEPALAAADLVVRIRQREGIDSLNVGHAAAIAFYRFGHV